MLIFKVSTNNGIEFLETLNTLEGEFSLLRAIPKKHKYFNKNGAEKVRLSTKDIPYLSEGDTVEIFNPNGVQKMIITNHSAVNNRFSIQDISSMIANNFKLFVQNDLFIPIHQRHIFCSGSKFEYKISNSLDTKTLPKPKHHNNNSSPVEYDNIQSSNYTWIATWNKYRISHSYKQLNPNF